MNKFKSVLFTAGISLALAFTFSCSSDGGVKPDGGYDAGISAVGGNNGSSSSAGFSYEISGGYTDPSYSSESRQQNSSSSSEEISHNQSSSSSEESFSSSSSAELLKCGDSWISTYNNFNERCNNNIVERKCGDSWYNPDTKFCYEAGSGKYPRDKCGGKEFDSTQRCENDIVESRCGSKPYIYYNAETQGCCNTFNGYEYKFALFILGDERCNDNEHIIEKRCGESWYRATQMLFCQSPNVVKNLCSGKTYPETQFCQAGTNTNTIKDLCGTETYTEKQFCQSPNVVKDLCGTKTYEATQFCQSSNVVKDLCGTETYTSSQFCQSPNVVKNLCNNKTYTSLQFCQAGTNTVKDLCGTETYTSSQFCQIDKNIVKDLCGDKTYSSLQFCQAGTNVVKNLCDNKNPYDATQFCYNKKIVPYCGNRTETFDPDLYECRAGDKIYLKNPISYGSNGEIYEAVLIGTQTWFAKNLNYNVLNSKCSDNNTNNCATYGRLYDWATAMDLASNCNTTNCTVSSPKGICPSGWHIPSKDELEQLLNVVKKSTTETVTKLKATSGWYSNANRNGNGTDDYGFAALPRGPLSDTEGNWWTVTQAGSYGAYDFYMLWDNNNVYYQSTQDKGYFKSIRCLMD